MKKAYYIIVILLATSFFVTAGGIARKTNPVNVHVIAIGVDNYPKTFNSFKNCVNDANDIVDKLLKDKTPKVFNTSGNTTTRGQANKKTTNDLTQKSEVFVHKLLNEEATLANIKNAFKEVIKNSTTKDYFVFYYAGYSFEIGESTEETILIPYIDIETEATITEYEKYDHLKLVELASYMNQIAAAKQLVISEAGQGKSFAENLQASLFESDVDIASNSERNRVILTTINYGMDHSICNSNNGPLTNYIMECGNMLDVFENYYDYEYKLNKTEIKCSGSQYNHSSKGSRYYYLTQEKDYTKILARHKIKSTGTRGSNSKQIKKDKKEKGNAETYALIIATNVYNENQTSWDNLKNPLNDANSVATILEQKYKAKVQKLYNEPKKELISGILSLKKQMDDNDKLLIFIAGHGYFSEDYSQGFIVSTDSHSLDEDVTLDSYFSMAKLNSILDGFPSKQVFTILDICYGATFELNNADLPIENYANTTIDNGVEKFIEGVDESYARIMLASGQNEVFDYWKDAQKHSPFASKLIKAFENEKDFISPGKIYSYVRGNTTKPILKKFGKHEVTGDFLLKVN